MTDESQKNPKIIVDEDWKSQVQAEQAAQRDDSTTGAEEQSGGADQLPPASFPMLVTTLATQAMAMMGQIPDPIEQKPVIRLDLAKHHIDTLAILQDKTKGNLTPEEAQMLEDVIHQLRMLYVAITEQAGPAGGPSGPTIIT